MNRFASDVQTIMIIITIGILEKSKNLSVIFFSIHSLQLISFRQNVNIYNILLIERVILTLTRVLRTIIIIRSTILYCNDACIQCVICSVWENNV